jgi:hypothetical protein
MRFARRNRSALLVVSVLLLASILVLRQYQLNASAHQEQVEDFILLVQKEQRGPAEHVYQQLVQSLPRLSYLTLVHDLRRTRDFIDPNVPASDSLIWKYHWAVKRYVDKEAEQRVARAVQRTQQK